MKEKEVFVYFDACYEKQPIFMGILKSSMIRGKEIFSFSYDQNWLNHSSFRNLDPNLRAYSGIQYLNKENSNFGMFLDSSPDRWGRILMKRREILLAKNENRDFRNLFEIDYLLGVYDKNRMGALRFKTDINGDFMDNNASLTTPPWASIRTLENACFQLEKDNSSEKTHYAKWLFLLVAPGSSLGGARPKANILDTSGRLWIAKFPSINDTKNVGAWEKIVNEVAASCNIHVPNSMAQKISNKYHTFLTQRFDRDEKGNRIHFASAMTLLNYTDGSDAAENASYLELAEFIVRNCIDPQKNLEELWRRIVFNIAISNGDDHLRNHGFILTPNGWTLSPAYDLNPEEKAFGLKLNIDENDNSMDFSIAMRVSKYFRLSETQANHILSEIIQKVAEWQIIANHYGISREEQEMMKLSFRIK